MGWKCESGADGMGWYLDSVLMGWDGIRILVLMGMVSPFAITMVMVFGGRMVKRW